MKNALCRAGVVLLLVSLMATALSSSALAATSYFQGFEVNNDGWNDNGGGAAIRTESGQNGISAATGNYYATAPKALWSAGGSTYTQFGGYESTFPIGGYFTSIAIYLNVDGDAADGSVFEWDSATATPTLGYGRDYIFHVGFYNAENHTAFGTGNRFVVTTSNNGDDNANPGTASRPKIEIQTSGWYTFKHVFQNVNGVVQVTMTISDANGNQVPGASWVLSNDSDIIGDAVGGHRYGWFDDQEFDLLAFDDVQLGSNDQIAPVTTASAEKADGSPYTFGSGTTQPVTITLSANDTGGTGLADTYYTIDGGDAMIYIDPFTISDEGGHTVQYWSTDEAGNQEAAHTVAVNVVRSIPGLITLTKQFEQNARAAHQMTSALSWANLGARIHNPGLERAGFVVFLYHVYQERGRSLTFEQANTLISLARQLYL